MTKKFKASDTPIMDLHALAVQNQNPKISHYKQGYEYAFNAMPKIDSVSTNWEHAAMDAQMSHLVHKLYDIPWVWHNIPIKGNILRTVIAMEKPECNGMTLNDGSELIVVNWKPGFKTPAHGHARGYMHERLIFGKMRQGTYRIVDPHKRIVRPIGVEVFGNTDQIIDAGFNHDNGIENGAFIHDFTILEPTATLNLVPNHPKDTNGNTYIIEEFGFKHISFQLEKLLPISTGATLKLPPGEVILVRSKNTKDLGDHFYVIDAPPHEKPVGMRPVGHAIQASSDFSRLLDTVWQHDSSVEIFRLMPEVRDWFLEWHGIQVQKTIVFPKP